MDTMSRLQDIFRDIFDDGSLMLTRQTTSNDIEDWDSLAHINIIMACESAFDIRFDLNDIAKSSHTDNAGNLADLIEGKLQ